MVILNSLGEYEHTITFERLKFLLVGLIHTILFRGSSRNYPLLSKKGWSILACQCLDSLVPNNGFAFISYKTTSSNYSELSSM